MHACAEAGRRLTHAARQSLGLSPPDGWSGLKGAVDAAKRKPPRSKSKEPGSVPRSSSRDAEGFVRCEIATSSAGRLNCLLLCHAALAHSCKPPRSKSKGAQL